MRRAQGQAVCPAWFGQLPIYTSPLAPDAEPRASRCDSGGCPLAGLTRPESNTLMPENGTDGHRPLSPAHGFTVLVIDDDPDLLESVCDLLRITLKGTKILATTRPDHALELLRQAPVHLILTDYRMGPLDGLELIARVRELYPNVPCILMTADQELDFCAELPGHIEVERAFRKPFDPIQLVAAVAHTLEGTRRAGT